MNNEMRWRQRFQNFEKAYQVFQRRLNDYERDRNSEAFQMSLVQAFEILMELAWKTLKDYLENEGMMVATPKAVIRQAFQSEIIGSGDEWMEALNQRNLTSHTYEEKTARLVLEFIEIRFAPIVRDMYRRLKNEL